MRFEVEEAQDKFELLMTMAFNGEEVLITNGHDVVKLEPIPEALISGKVWAPDDFVE